MNEIVKLITNPVDVFKEQRKELAFSLVGLSLLVLAVERLFDEGLIYALYTIIVGIVLYLADCFIFYMCCKSLGSKMKLKGYIEKWGLTFLPNLCCCIIVAITEHCFYVLIGNILATLFLNFAFVGILLWKTLVFSAFLKMIVGLKEQCLVVAHIILIITITVMAVIHGYIGMKVPVI